eukprot:GFUD01028849.1.p1 GENE.GFUD01028849.1~~GFUD01028849.1.p1  ORF type:complete len:297 (-),score=80.02 GFUD01028849.1:293-1183(-)
MIMTKAMRKMMCVMTVDLVCILLVAIPCLLLNFVGDPYIRGFFCSDSTLRHPYLESTVPTWALIMISYILPGTIFCLVETSILKHSDTFTSVRLSRELYNTMGVFVFGSMVNQLLTDTTKYTIGRLRPHFIEICSPNLTLTEAVCGTIDQPVYITEYECLGQADSSLTQAELVERLHDVRLSFVSGHASLSAYSMWFSIVYLQRRMGTRNFRLVKPLIQVGCALSALFICLSRVSDYKHHPEDVLCGALLGLVISTLTYNFLNSRQENSATRATSTTSLINVSTSRLYTEEVPVSP